MFTSMNRMSNDTTREVGRLPATWAYLRPHFILLVTNWTERSFCMNLTLKVHAACFHTHIHTYMHICLKYIAELVIILCLWHKWPHAAPLICPHTLVYTYIQKMNTTCSIYMPIYIPAYINIFTYLPEDLVFYHCIFRLDIIILKSSFLHKACDAQCVCNKHIYHTCIQHMIALLTWLSRTVWTSVCIWHTHISLVCCWPVRPDWSSSYLAQ